MGIIKKEIPPPDVKEGEVLAAKIKEIVYPVDSVYKDEQGKPKQQMDFAMELESGYPFRVFMAYYERPSERSVLGALVLHVQKEYGQEFETIEEAIAGIRKHGRLYVKVSKFSEWNGKLYPRFKVVGEKLPPKLETQTALAETSESTVKFSRAEVEERIKNWPQQQQTDYLKYLKDTGQLENP